MDKPDSDTELQLIIKRLDEMVATDGAKVQVLSEGDGNEGGLVANKTGYLRLGIEMLKTAFAPEIGSSSSKRKIVHADLNYLIDEDSAFVFNWFERKEAILPICQHISAFDRIMPFVIIGVLISGIGLAIFGLITLIRWIL